MRIAVGSDHRGDEGAASLTRHLEAAGHDVSVLASCGGESCDYPEGAYAVGEAVRRNDADRGILVCGSGIGMAIAANKVAGVRAAVVQDLTDARMSRLHNDANVLCLSADRTPPAELLELVDTWLATEFEGGRHTRRVGKITAIEQGEDPSKWQEGAASTA